MTLQYVDRVQETFSTTGTGTISLGGSVTGYQAFGTACNNSDTAYYAATDGTNWEVGLGTYATSGNTFARTTIYASSNGGAAVSWAAGTKNIWLNVPATYYMTKSITKLNAVVIAASGTYTPSPNLVYAQVEMVGGGGGGGGTDSSHSYGVSGASGGYLLALLTAAQIGASQTVTIGAAGTAGANTGGTGGTGGTTSFGSLLSCAGGTGGTGNGAGSTSAFGVAGGTATVTTGISMRAFTGQASGNAVNNGANLAIIGPGGGNPLGFGAALFALFGAGNSFAGNAPTGFGSGGGGASQISSTAAAGAAGAPGVVIVTEYIAG